MSDISILRQMVNPDATVQISNTYGNNRWIVTLDEPQCPESKATISGLPKETIVIRADAFKSVERFFAGTKDECKRADFLIITETPRLIFCLEMKRVKGALKEVIGQLKGAKCLALFCREIGKEFWEHKDFLSDYDYRFISLGRINLSKQKTRIDRTAGLHDRPERMLKLDWREHIEFKHLIGKTN